jgi:hypothetical protein
MVWYMQGSGKSITMLWLALKVRHDETNGNPISGNFPAIRQDCTKEKAPEPT